MKRSTSLLLVVALALAGCAGPAPAPYHQVAVTLPRGPGPFPTLILASNLTRPTLVPEARRGRGATIAYDPAALRDAEKRLREFFHRHFAR